MAITRLYDFTPGTTIVSSQVDGEFDNIINNALSLISPLTGTLNANSNQITNLRLENVTATPSGSSAGRIVFHTSKAEVQVMDGSFVRHVPTTATPTQGDLVVATDSSIWGKVALGSVNQFLVVRSGLPAWSTSSVGALATQAGYVLTGSVTWAPGTLIATMSATTSVTVTGAQAGDAAFAGFTGIGPSGTRYQLVGNCVTNDAVLVTLANLSSNSSLVTSSGTVKVVVWRF